MGLSPDAPGINGRCQRIGGSGTGPERCFKNILPRNGPFEQIGRGGAPNPRSKRGPAIATALKKDRSQPPGGVKGEAISDQAN